ncbi:hypothetical protein ACTFIR_003847 [Dictyostelium discoideum]
MNYDNIICIQCNEKLKNFKNIIIHFIMHKNLCPFCVASYKSHKQFYDGNGHFNNKKCKTFQSLIITNKEKRDSFYKKLKDITGEKLIYPTKDSDDPCNHLYAQNQDELLYEENNQNNQTNNNEENETIGLQYSDDENNEIESAQNKPVINFDNEQNKLNEIEIEFLIALFSTLLGNGFNLRIGNEQIDVVPFGLTMDIPEFRTSCKLNGHNSNEYACHTCDKSRDGLFICQSGTLRKQEDITNFHSTKPKYDELYNDIELKQRQELMNFHLLLHYPIYIKNWGVPKYTSAETFEAQLSRIKIFLSNNTNNRDEQYQRVTTLNMVKFFNSVDKLKSIEDESTTLIMGNKINNPDNLNNTKLKIDSLFKNYQHLTFHTSIKNNIEVYNVGDAIEVASDNVLSGRWSGIINSILMVDMGNNIIKHSILLNYFEKFDGDQLNKYHFLSNQLNI